MEEKKSVYYNSLIPKARKLIKQYGIKEKYFFNDYMYLSFFRRLKGITEFEYPMLNEISFELASLIHSLIIADEEKKEITVSLKRGSKTVKTKIRKSVKELIEIASMLLYRDVEIDHKFDSEFQELKIYKREREIISKNFDSFFDCIERKPLVTKKVYPPFEIDELQELISHSKPRRDVSERLKLKVVIAMHVEEFKKLEIFDNSVKTIRTNEACFLYDMIELLQIIPLDGSMNENDKYQYIRNLLK